MIPFRKQINHYAINRKKIYDHLSIESKNRIDKLSQCVWKDIKPVVFNKDRNYPRIGDIFEYKPHKKITLFGLVINNNIKYRYDGKDDLGWLTIVIFNPDITDYSKVINKISKDDLLLFPSIVSNLHWKKGYFHNIYHVDSFKIIDSYGFDNPFEGRYETDEGKPICRQPRMFTIIGIMTERGLSYEVLYQLIARGIDFNLPLKNDE